MARYKPYDYNQLMMVPVSLEEQLVPGTLEYAIHLGYSRGLTSSRSLERACLENVTFMALTCGQKPDHSTIAPFVSSMGEEVEALFTQVLLVCDEEGLLGGTHFPPKADLPMA